jgi:hypothetical protein
VLAGRAGAFEACLAEARSAEPKIALEWEWLPVPVTMVLGPAGKVSSSVVDDPELNRSALGRCILRECEVIDYPAFSGEPVRVTTTVHLHARASNTHNTRRRGL